MQAPRILFVEDDITLRHQVTDALQDDGYVVLALADGVDATAVAAEFHPDIALLDIALPGPDGRQVAARLRQNSDLPVVFLTAADKDEDEIAGLATGDDYVTKPFVTGVLLARLRAVLRRAGKDTAGRWCVGDLVIDEPRRLATRGQPLQLTPTEFDLLCVLARNKGRVVSHLQLLREVWHRSDPGSANLVHTHVGALRRKLHAHGPPLLHTSRTAGYVLEA